MRKFLLIYLALILAVSLPLRAYEKIKDYLSITTGAVETRILNGDLDPSASSGVAAPIGSEYLRDDGDSFKKVGSDDTEWIRQLNTSTPVGLELMEDPSFEKSVSSYCVSDNTAPFLTSNTSLKSPNNKKGTRINLRESGVTNYTCTIPVSAAYEGTPIRHKGWLTLWSNGNFPCSIVAQWNGADVGNAQIITSSQNTYYDLEVIPTGAGDTGFKLSCDNTTANTTYFVIHDETSNKAEKISPVLANIGNVAEWQNFTPTGTWTTNTTYSGKWRRVGDSIELQYAATLSGTPNSTGLYFYPPSFIEVDTSKISAIANTASFGSGSARDASSNAFFHLGAYYSASTNYIGVYPYAQFGTPANGSITSQMNEVLPSLPFVFTTGDTVTASLKLPIKGWSATSPTIVMQNETFNSDLHLGAWVAQPNTATCSSAVIEGEANVGKWTTCSQVTANNLDMTGCTARPTQSDLDARSQGLRVFTRDYATARPCTTPVRFYVNIGKNLSSNTGGKLYSSTARTSAERSPEFFTLSSSSQYGAVTKVYNPVTGILEYSAELTGSGITSATFRFESGNASSGYLVINASKNPAMSGVNVGRVHAYISGHGTAVAVPSSGAIPFVNVNSDTHNAWSVASSEYTVPESGVYQISYSVGFSTNVNAWTYVICGNGTSPTFTNQGVAANTYVSAFSCPFIKGEKISVRQGNPTNVSRTTMSNNGNIQYLTITKIGF